MFTDTPLKEIRRSPGKSGINFTMSILALTKDSRIFFENAGGALTLKSVAETSGEMAAIPDNQGRDNPASQKLIEIITTRGTVFVGESGTELLFRLVRTAVVGAPESGVVLGCTLEHSAAGAPTQHHSRDGCRNPLNKSDETSWSVFLMRYINAIFM